MRGSSPLSLLLAFLSRPVLHLTFPDSLVVYSSLHRASPLRSPPDWLGISLGAALIAFGMERHTGTMFISPFLILLCMDKSTALAPHRVRPKDTPALEALGITGHMNRSTFYNHEVTHHSTHFPLVRSVRVARLFSYHTPRTWGTALFRVYRGGRSTP